MITLSFRCWDPECGKGAEHDFPVAGQVIRVRHNTPLRVVASERQVIASPCEDFMVRDVLPEAHQVLAVPVRQFTPTEVWIPIDLIDFTA